MAVIIPVHGTFASGETKGANWWQSGSLFEGELRRLVQSESGPLVIQPLVWDGANRETSRREAGAKLAEQMCALEKAGESYALVGHSHGGTVILAAINRCVFSRQKIPRLSRWITVGTPFIEFTPKTGLFSRLGLTGRAAYLSILISLLIVAIATWPSIVEMPARISLVAVAVLWLWLLSYRILSWASYRQLSKSGASISHDDQQSLVWPRFGLVLSIVDVSILYFAVQISLFFAIGIIETSTPTKYATGIVAPLFAGFLAHLSLAWLNRYFARAAAHRRANIMVPAMNALVGLRHRHDEAIAGLGRIHDVGFQIFSRDIIVSQFMFAAVLAVPILVLGLLVSPTAMLWLVGQSNTWSGYEKFHLPGDGHAIGENAKFLATALSQMVGLGDGYSAMSSLTLVLMPALIFCASLIAILLIRAGAQAMSGHVSRFLDRVAWEQIRASAFGANAHGELARLARSGPSAANRLQVPLPEELGAKISAISDMASAESISKLRIAVNELAFSGKGGQRSELATHYLSWDELIHTAYFKVPLFNKLVAYAIAASPGFKPSPEFLADPDFHTLRCWFLEITNMPADTTDP